MTKGKSRTVRMRHLVRSVLARWNSREYVLHFSPATSFARRAALDDVIPCVEAGEQDRPAADRPTTIRDFVPPDMVRFEHINGAQRAAPEAHDDCDGESSR